MPIIMRTKTVYYCIWCSALVVLAVVVWIWVVICVYTSISTCFGHHCAHHQENKDRVLLHMVFCTGCAGCGCVELGCKLCAHFYLNMFRTSLCPSSGEQEHVLLHMVFCAASTTSAEHHMQYYTVFVILMMSIMMSETCWDRSLIINIGLVASCWVIPFHPELFL
jgi:hypothetical protein